MSDFSNVEESSGLFGAVSESSTVDFSDQTEVSGVFASSGTESASTFIDVGDGGYIVVESVGFGEGGFGEGGFGGYNRTFTINAYTPWVNVDTP